MINRVLIRIKVVQLLYSYLLNRSDFQIASAPSDNSRDSQYAYSLYLDLLLLAVELSGIDTRAGHVGRRSKLAADKALSANKMVKALITNDQLLSTITRNTSGHDRFNDLLPDLLRKIQESVVFADYKKIDSPTIRDDARFWQTVMTTIIARDPKMLEAASQQNDSFTHRGYERAFEMAAATFSGVSENRSAVIEARNSLDRSFDKAYQLYHMLLWLCVEITDMEERRLDSNKHKFLPTDADLNPDMRFVNNKFVEALRQSTAMADYMKDNPFSWVDDDEVMLRHMLDAILSSDFYAEYMQMPSTTFADDCELWRKIFRRIILSSDDLTDALENRSVFWNDDLDIMGTFVVKTIKRAASSEDGTVTLLPKYKDDTDRRFGPDLFNCALDNYDTYRSYIEKFTPADWDIERASFIDIVTIVVAIAELITFPEIPVAVTVNEYVEIANAYSTHKSGQFVNGMLASIIRYLHDEHIIDK